MAVVTGVVKKYTSGGNSTEW